MREITPDAWLQSGARLLTLTPISHPDHDHATKKRQQYIVGVDLGGTNIVVGAMSADGTHHYAMRSMPTSAESGAEGVADRIVGVDRRRRSPTRSRRPAPPRSDFIGVGIGAPGPLDREKGIVIVAPNLGWRNFPLRDRIARAARTCRRRSTTTRTARRSANGGRARRAAARNVIGMTIGTGIGGGLIIDGELFHGASDVAGEIGHTTIDLNGRHCKCGNYGCLEAYASGPAIADARARSARARGDGVAAAVDGRRQARRRSPPKRSIGAAQQGDAVANEIVRDTARYLGAGIANLLNIFNADVVVVAGGVTQAGDALFVPLRAEVRRRAFRPAVDATRIVPGELPGTAGVVGAVATFKMQHLGAL